MATAAEQTALAAGVHADNFDKLGVVNGIVWGADLVVHVMAGAAFHGVVAVQQETVDRHVISAHERPADGCQHGRGRWIQPLVFADQGRIIGEGNGM